MTHRSVPKSISSPWPIIFLCAAAAAGASPFVLIIAIDKGGGALLLFATMCLVSAIVLWRNLRRERRDWRRVLDERYVLARWTCGEDDFRRLNDEGSGKSQIGAGDSREVVISLLGVAAGKHLHDWSAYANSLTEVEIEGERPGVLHFTYTEAYRLNRETEHVHIPIPSGHEAEAKRIYDTFLASREKARVAKENNPPNEQLSPEEDAERDLHLAIWNDYTSVATSLRGCLFGATSIGIMGVAVLVYFLYRAVTYVTAVDSSEYELAAPDGGVAELAISADGRLIASRTLYSPDTEDKGVRLCRSADGSLLHTFDDPRSAASSIALSRDGRRIAIARGSRVDVFDISSRARISRCRAEGFEAVNTLSFSRDGSLLLGKGGAYYVWRVTTGSRVKTIGHEGGWSPMACAISDSGDVITAESNVLNIRVRNHTTGQLLLGIPLDGSLAAYPMALSSDASTFAVQGARDVSIWKLRAPERALRLPSEPGIATDLIFSHDGNRLLCNRWSMSRTVWDVPSARTLLHVEVSEDLSSCALSENGARCALETKGGGVDVWDLATGAIVSSRVHRDGLFELSPRITQLGLSFDGSMLVTSNETIRTWAAMAK